MPRIHRLPPALANQIAAGEVVERPASVVKELVENALDAGARRIDITIELGGKRLIRVEDDGEGMGEEDARLAIERHATSKIASASDLEAIRTLGFRGEALPSIASVSRFTLRTRHRDETAAIELDVCGGAVERTRQVGAAVGTLVEVRDLFFNLPARRKFLKADSAESAQVSRLVTQLALAYPEVGFTLASAGRQVLETPPAPGLRERFFQLFGERDDLTWVERQTGPLAVKGFVAVLTDQGPVRGPQHIFVNRRIVKDRTIAHAISQAYATAMLKEKSPEAHLFLNLPSDRVDVNVHPTKAEVRFLEPSFVHEVLRHTIEDALGNTGPPELHLQPGVARAVAFEPALPGVFSGVSFQGRWTPSTAGQPPRATSDDRATDEVAPSAWSAQAASPRPLDDAERAAVDSVKPMAPLGQFRDTYIIAVDSDGIAIIDQHVAHERILYEQMLARLTTGAVERQRLLVPILLDLSLAQREALAAHAADLERLGFEVDAFGGSSLRVSAVPSLLGAEKAAEAVRALAEDLEGLDKGSAVADAMKRIAATTACHAAVKANYPLTLEKMQYLLAELKHTAYSSVCPHGRPVVLRLSRRELEKNFERI